MSQFSQRMTLADDALFQEHGDAVTIQLTETSPLCVVEFAIVSEEVQSEIETDAGWQLVYDVFVQFVTAEDSPKYCGFSDLTKEKAAMTWQSKTYSAFQVSRDKETETLNVQWRRYGRFGGVQRRSHGGN